jgi:exodeoxyribonuclease V gamma subunit
LDNAVTESGVLGDELQQLQAREAAQKSYVGDGAFLMGEGDDVYLARCFPELTESHWPTLEHWAMQLLLPLHQRLQEVQA